MVSIYSEKSRHARRVNRAYSSCYYLDITGGCLDLLSFELLNMLLNFYMLYILTLSTSIDAITIVSILPPLQPIEIPLHLGQILIGALLYNLALIKDDDLAGIRNGGDAMGDGEGGLALRQLVEALEDQLLCGDVQGACGLVEEVDVGVVQGAARDGDALFLPAGDLDALGADLLVVA